MPTTITKAHFNAFKANLEWTYERLFVSDPEYVYIAIRTTPAALAEKMTIGLAEGKANKDGKAIKIACRALGIAYTYKAIATYLRA